MKLEDLEPKLSDIQERLLVYAIFHSDSSGKTVEININDFEKDSSIIYQREEWLQNDIEALVKLQLVIREKNLFSVTKLINMVEYGDRKLIIRWQKDMQDFIIKEKERLNT